MACVLQEVIDLKLKHAEDRRKMNEELEIYTTKLQAADDPCRWCAQVAPPQEETNSIS